MKDIIKAIKLRKERGDYVFVCGNGGSASTAEHFTSDLFNAGVRAICLNSNVSIMTMIANDYGYDYVFSKQLEVYSEPDDLLIVFSYSGLSENILQASYNSGLEVIRILGNEGESYQEAENRHLALAHEISNAI
jgi:D-sedoheptulose 7-phosphate isomerase